MKPDVPALGAGGPGNDPLSFAQDLDLDFPANTENGPDPAWMSRLHRAMDAATDWNSLTMLCQAFVNACGYDRFIYMVDIPAPERPGGCFSLSTYPREWLSLYDGNGYSEFDPMLARAFTETRPFDWSEVTYTNGKTSEMKARAHAYGIRTGCSIPVRGVSATCAVLNMASSGNLKLEGAKGFAIQSAGVLIAQQMLGKAIHFAEAQRAEYDSLKKQIPARDVKLLRQLGSGFTIEQLSRDLSIDYTSLKQHLEAILKILSCGNLDEGLMKASVIGLIDWSYR